MCLSLLHSRRISSIPVPISGRFLISPSLSDIRAVVNVNDLQPESFLRSIQYGSQKGRSRVLTFSLERTGSFNPRRGTRGRSRGVHSSGSPPGISPSDELHVNVGVRNPQGKKSHSPIERSPNWTFGVPPSRQSDEKVFLIFSLHARQSSYVLVSLISWQ